MLFSVVYWRASALRIGIGIGIGRGRGDVCSSSNSLHRSLRRPMKPNKLKAGNQCHICYVACPLANGPDPLLLFGHSTGVILFETLCAQPDGWLASGRMDEQAGRTRENAAGLDSGHKQSNPANQAVHRTNERPTDQQARHAARKQASKQAGRQAGRQAGICARLGVCLLGGCRRYQARGRRRTCKSWIMMALLARRHDA